MTRFKMTLCAALSLCAWMVAAPLASFAQMPILPGAAPAGPTTATLTKEQRADLIAKLAKVKERDKRHRDNWSQNPLKQSDYDEKIDQINRISKGLQSGSDYSMADVEQAMRFPKSDPYH